MFRKDINVRTSYAAGLIPSDVDLKAGVRRNRS